MEFYTTISDQINAMKAAEISYRNLHRVVCLDGPNGIIKIPYKSIMREYRDAFDKIVIEGNFSQREIVKYRYKPKWLSLDLYGTTEIWSALIELNKMYSILDFNMEKQPKIYNPSEFKRVLNEVMILEGLLG